MYHTKKEQNPDYEYNCPQCKVLIQNGRLAAALRRNSSIDDESLSASQESLYNDEQMDTASVVSGTTDINEKISSDFGLGKGKPLSASKLIAKKRLGGAPSGQVGRPKGGGKCNFQKKQRVSEFGRKRGPKAKMRGIFGVPGLGLQRPTSDASNKTDEEPGVENRLVLCSAKDKFVLTQDICVMCGAIGTDQEGCLISCVQCGQCYHPYCVTVKVTKVILQKGWRCLDCTVCEGCGQKHDESRLILCDDCDISYHIYCMDPPLDIVPHGTWKCKWCAICQKCGTNTPGTNCTWQNSFTECGPCASQSQCPSCSEGYAEGELIIQCTHCERWLHCICDSIQNEDDAEKCADEGYKCLLCRPKDAPPPHLMPKKKVAPLIVPKAIIAPTAPKACDSDAIEPGPVFGMDGNHLMDGICLSESGLHQIKTLQTELVRKKRKNKLIAIEPPPAMSSVVKDQDASIMAAIESVVAGSSLDNSIEEMKLEPLDPREEAEIYKDGMVWDRTDSSPPEGFTLSTTENGTVVLRKKRQRNLQKLGIGGFTVRNRMGRKDDKDDDDNLDGTVPQFNENGDKKKKAIRKKVKSKLIETYPSYLQEAFFGKGLLITAKPKFELSSSDDETKASVSDDKTIKLSSEELKLMENMRVKQQQQQQKLLEEQNKVSAPTLSQSLQTPQQLQQSQQPLAQLQSQPPLQQQSQSQQQQIPAGEKMFPYRDIKPLQQVAFSTITTTTSSSNVPNAIRSIDNSLDTNPCARNDVDASDAEALKDILPGDVHSIHSIQNQSACKNYMNVDDDELTKTPRGISSFQQAAELISSFSRPEPTDSIASGHFDDLTGARELSNGDRKDELADILNNLAACVEFSDYDIGDGNRSNSGQVAEIEGQDSKDVEEMFKGLTDESQVMNNI